MRRSTIQQSGAPIEQSHEALVASPHFPCGRGSAVPIALRSLGNLGGAGGVKRVVVVRPLTLAELRDGELVRRARAGDVAAYEQLVERYSGPVFRAAYHVTRSRVDAQEAAQDAFVKAYAALERFREDAPLRPWLLKIAVNEARNRIRASGRRDALALRAAAERPPEGADPSPEAAVMAAERRHELLAAFERLRQEDQLVIACRYFLELNEREVAEMLGWRRGTVKSRLSRALGRLRAELEQESPV